MYNFSAGPAQLPQEVLMTAQQEMFDWHGSGLSVMEMPFTSDEYQEISQQAYNDLHKLINLPDRYQLLFLQGGAYAHFALIAMNLLGKNSTADYIQTGHWSTRAINEAKRYGRINIAASNAASGFNHIPPVEQWRRHTDAAYCHITTNETADGVQFPFIPKLDDTPLVADVTSDFLTRDMDICRFGLIYASAQKNIGPTGLTIIIVHQDLLDQAQSKLPTVFNYGLQAKSNGRINTPPTYSIYIAGLMFSWLLKQGGINAIEQRNRLKAKRLYDAIDSNDFYRCTVVPAARSMVNICFELIDAGITEDFVDKARQAGLLNLQGHGVRGGVRVSLYNAMPVEAVDALIDFMHSYSASHAHRIRKKDCST